jgi:hypothetical protein
MSDEAPGRILGEIIRCLYIFESLSLTRLLLMLKKSTLESARGNGDQDSIDVATNDYAQALELHRIVASAFSDDLLRLQEIKLKLEGKYSTEMTEVDLINDVGWPAQQWYLDFKTQVESLLDKM